MFLNAMPENIFLSRNLSLRIFQEFWCSNWADLRKYFHNYANRRFYPAIVFYNSDPVIVTREEIWYNFSKLLPSWKIEKWDQTSFLCGEMTSQEVVKLLSMIEFLSREISREKMGRAKKNSVYHRHQNVNDIKDLAGLLELLNDFFLVF